MVVDEMSALRRCRNIIVADNVDLIDVDTYDFNNVIDLSESLTKKRVVSNDKSRPRPKRTYIFIDDDESPSDHHAGAGERNFENGASSSRRYGPDISPVKLSKGKRTYSGRGFRADSESESSDDDDSPDCEFIEDLSGKFREQWERASLKRKADVRSDCGGRKGRSNDGGSSKNKQKNAQVPNFKATRSQKKSGSSYSREGNLSDCDARDDLDVDGGKDDLPVRRNKNKQKDAEVPKFKATHREKRSESSFENGSIRDDNLSDCDARADLPVGRNKNKQKEAEVPNFKAPRHMKKGESSTRKVNSRENNLSDCDARVNVEVDGGKDDLPVGETPVCEDEIMVESDEPIPSTSSEEENEKNDLENDDVPVEDSIIDQREKLKETDEYKRALEEELSARQTALRIQAEEAQQLKRLQKRKKAEQLRLLDMERRQKQRVDEIRETQKKDEENMNLKEQYRTEFRQELKKLETTCLDMASLLRGLGIQIGNGVVPSPNEVRAAYKRALLSFHPDRSSGSNMRQQVEAEEKFKLISRMKEKLSL